MSNFIFIKENYSENNNETIYAIDRANFKTLNVSDTYGNYGQKCDAADAGDSLTLLTEKAVKAANDAYNKPYTCEEDFEYNEYVSVGDYISAYDNRDAYNAAASLVEDVDISFNKLTVKGMTYWDGHNYQTITIECEHGEPTHTVIEDAELIEKLNNAIENREFEKEGFGTKTYRFEDIEMTHNYCQGSFSSYEITID